MAKLQLVQKSNNWTSLWFWSGRLLIGQTSDRAEVKTCGFADHIHELMDMMVGYEGVSCHNRIAASTRGSPESRWKVRSQDKTRAAVKYSELVCSLSTPLCQIFSQSLDCLLLSVVLPPHFCLSSSILSASSPHTLHFHISASEIGMRQK